MEEGQFSRTALSTAYMRAYHARHDDPKIFDDYLAYHLLTDEIRATLAKHLARPLHHIDPERFASCPDQATALAWSMQAMAVPPIVLGRTRYAEDSLNEAVGQGVQQYVILGAGLDTFAFRRTEMLSQLQVFEVDHPDTQAYKRRRLAEVGWEHPEQLHFVPVDFERESLADALTRSSYNPRVKSFFSWLGVTMYLTREVVWDTLRDLADAAPQGSTVVFDYLDADAFIPERASRRVQVMMDGVRMLGEPMVAGFDPSTLGGELERLGLGLHENLSPADIQERYFRGRTDGYKACEHAYFAWAAVD